MALLKYVFPNWFRRQWLKRQHRDLWGQYISAGAKIAFNEQVGKRLATSLDFIDGACDEYATLDDEGRTRVRKKFSWASKLLLLYEVKALYLLDSAADSKWLHRGLIAISIEDNRLDFRDTCGILGELWLCAVRHGIDPLPVVKQIASMSNPQPVYKVYGQSMREFLTGFHDSAFFSESVAPRLK